MGRCRDDPELLVLGPLLALEDLRGTGRGALVRGPRRRAEGDDLAVRLLRLDGAANQLAAHGEGIELYRTGSVVGYCMLPLCLLAALAVVLPGGLFTGVVAGVLVMWCTSKATAQFMRSLPQSSDGKRLVVAYPCFTLYCLFALLSVF